MGTITRRLLLYFGIILCFHTLECLGGSKHQRTRPLASTVAAKTGAAVYEESREAKGTEVRTKVRKRLAIDPDIDDIDLENYQGVLGRPGVDFPVLKGIPKTGFNCNSYGNGYFADLETNCQVFHICDEGRKISFLCPNGTIFRQLDLICDWWFKVDCASSPSQYVESSEQLARDQRLREDKRKQLTNEFNVESLSGEPLKPIDHRIGKALITNNRRMDKNYGSEGNPESIESFEFVDVNMNKHNKNAHNTARIHYSAKLRMSPKRTFEPASTSSSKELQEVAETASFARPRQLLNGYNYPNPISDSKPSGYDYPKPQTQNNSDASNPTDRTGKRLESAKPVNNIFEPSKPTGFGFEPAKTSNNNIFEPKPFNTRPTEALSTTKASPRFSVTTTSTTVAPTTQQSRGSTTYQSSLDREKVENTKPTETTTPKNVRRPTTPLPSTYSTAKKLTQNTKTSVFYTPTIPSITNKSNQQETTEKLTTVTYSTTPTPRVSEHAIEMMKTLQEIGGIDVEPTEDTEKYQGQRPGLEVPPSSGPSALHSLALYFATTSTEGNTTLPTPSDNDFQGKTDSDIEFSTEANTPTITAAHLSEKTLNQYQALFEAENKHVPTNDTKVNSRFNDENDLDTEFSRNPIYAAVGSPQIRELAQVFTHALSAYLQDPDTFRKILSEIRPTEPPSVESNEVLESRLSHKDVFHGEEASYTFPKTATTSTSTTSPTEDFEVLDFSDVTVTNQRPVTTTTTEIPTTTKISVPIPVSRILPPFSSNSIERTPGSQKVVEPLEKEAINFYNRKGKNLETTTIANPLAIEINGGLALSTNFPFDSSESTSNNSSETTNENDFFSNENIKDKKTDSLYGTDVKPINSEPLRKFESKEVSDYWGDETTTILPTTEAIPTVSSDLLPPFKSTTSAFPPSKYYEPPVNSNEESLQRAQSQSIYSSGINNLKNGEKREKSYFNYVTVTEEPKSQITRFVERTKTTTELPETTTTPPTSVTRGHFITRKITTLDEGISTPLPDVFKTTIPDTGKVNTNSKTTVAYTVFLDPLTINDGLMDIKEQGDSESRINKYLPRDQTTEHYTETVTNTPTFTASTKTSTVSSRKGKELNAHTTPIYNRLSPVEKDITESHFMTVMQKKANEMFGRLNETQADHLMNVMKQADKNKNVRKLILLLIQTCDDDYNKTVEESRNALLQALIQMDSKELSSDVKVFDSRNQRKGRTDLRITVPRSSNLRTTEEQTTIAHSTETTPAITTYKSANHNRFTSAEATIEYSFATSTSIGEQTTTPYSEYETTTNNIGSTSFFDITTTTEIPSTSTTDYPTTVYRTTTPITTTTEEPSTSTSKKPRTRTRTKVSSSTQSSRVQKSLGVSEDFLAESSSHYGSTKHSDARALELLRSLYSLASRWG